MGISSEIYASKDPGLTASCERKHDTLVLPDLRHLTQDDFFQSHPLTSDFITGRERAAISAL